MTPIELPDWVKPGAVFAVDGSTEKILDVTPTKIEVVTFDSFGSWPIPTFWAALASGRVTRPANPERVRRQPSRTVSRGAKRGKLPELTESFQKLPITDPSRIEIVRTVFHTVRALSSGQSVQPPHAVLVMWLAHAGAYAEGLGPAVAYRKPQGGRLPYSQAEAQEAQALLATFTRWMGGEGDLEASDEFRTIRHFVDRGLEAVGLIAPQRVPRGRPEGRLPDHVRYEISRHWHAHKAGRYSVRQAIEEVAKENVLHRKQVDAAWAGQDHLAVELGDEDQETLGRAISRLERAYYDRPPLTVGEVARRRTQIAAMLHMLRASRKKTFSSVGPAAPG